MSLGNKLGWEKRRAHGLSAPWNKGLKGLAIGWPKGTKFSVTHRKNLSVANSKPNPLGSASRTGRKSTPESSRKKRLAMKGRKTGFDAIAVVDKRIKDEIIELERQGFRCVPVGGKVRPDIIAIKDGKIYAVEVEYKKRPDYAKYNDEARQ